jgi:hypothetical protein
MAENLKEIFLRMAQDDKGTNLLNVYKGVPLSFPAKIIEIGDAHIRVLTETHQMVSMYLEKSTLIQSGLLPNIVLAEVIELDIKQHHALLANFRFMQKGIGDRSEVRIEPKEPLPSAVQDKEEQMNLKGELADISREGLGIYLDRDLFSAKVIHPNALLDVMFTLPFEFAQSLDQTKNQSGTGFYDRYARENVRFNPVGNNSPRFHTGPLRKRETLSDIQVKAKVVNIHLEMGRDRYRIGMKMAPDSQAAMVISKFISQRQCEIIQEIRELYQLLVNPEVNNPSKGS